MRAVNKDVNAVPAALVDVACLAHLDQIVASGGALVAEGRFYRGEVILANGVKEKTVANALRDLYKRKCAYCELFCHEPYVEHYRPKGKVFGTPSGNRGYYWLAYEWTNLVPSCHECNSIVRKGSRFPIQNVRQVTHPLIGNPAVFDSASNRYSSQYLVSEGPLLVHPEYCPDPFVHFDFDTDGAMIGLTPEGTATIQTMDLSRGDLCGWRRNIYNGHLTDFQRLVYKYTKHDSTKTLEWFEEEIKDLVVKIVYESLIEENQFTLFRRVLVRKIEYFFIDPFEAVFHGHLRSAISKALQGL
jgi:uncharacterized protein (TIGR02646 family)